MKFPAMGGSYTLPSVNADCQRSLNLFPEVDESGAGRSAMIMRRTPGISLFSTPTFSGSVGPIRGVWPGANRLFVASGTYLFEVFQDGTYLQRGNIGNDGLPVQMFPNGTQLLIISAGNAYIDIGTGAVLATMGSTIGLVDTAGTAVTWVSGGETDGQDTTGGQFQPSMAGRIILIGGSLSVPNPLPYVVQSVTDANNLVLATSAGVQLSAYFSVPYLQGTCTTLGTTVFYASGDLFDPVHSVGAHIAINGTYSHITACSLPGGCTVDFDYGVISTPVPFWYDPVVVARTGAFLDGYYIVAEPNSNIFRLSQLFDGSAWDPLDYATKEAYPDHIAAILADHEQLWLMGDEGTSEEWQDTGAETFPFQRDPGGFIHYGCIAPWSLCRFDNGVAWLAFDEQRGGPICVYAQGFQPVRISNHAIEQAWASYATTADAVAYSYIDGGHHFLSISFPTANKTWVYDATASADAKQPLWHERGWWNGATVDRQRQAFHAFVGIGTSNMAHYVGDWQNGNIYTMSQAYLSDNGTLIDRIRTTPHIANENLRVFFSRYELLAAVQSGVINPILTYSVDSGNTFINPQQRSSNQPGVTNQYLTRLLWWRLGSSRDRVFSIEIKDIADFTLIDMFYEAEAGTS